MSANGAFKMVGWWGLYEGAFLLCINQHDMVPSRCLALDVKGFHLALSRDCQPFLPSALSAGVVPAFGISILYWHITQER